MIPSIVILLIVLYIINKRWFRVVSVAFQGEELIEVTVQRGFFKRNRTLVSVGKSSNGYKLHKEGDFYVLSYPTGSVKKFYSYQYYKENGLNPAEVYA